MSNKTIRSTNPYTTASNAKLLEDLKLLVISSENKLYTSASQPGEGVNADHARIKQNLHALKMHLHSDGTHESALTHQYINITDQHKGNPWKTVCISACANLIIGLQNTIIKCSGSRIQ